MSVFQVAAIRGEHDDHRMDNRGYPIFVSKLFCPHNYSWIDRMPSWVNPQSANFALFGNLTRGADAEPMDPVFHDQSLSCDFLK